MPRRRKYRRNNLKKVVFAVPRAPIEGLLNFAITQKQTEVNGNEWYRIAASRMQGWHPQMEDFFTQILPLDNDPESAFFAVYDGDHGAQVAKFAKVELHNYICKRQEYDHDIGKAMKNAFQQMDIDLLSSKRLGAGEASTTVAAVIIKDNILYCANFGNSHVIGCINGQMMKLTVQHTASYQPEMSRILEVVPRDDHLDAEITTSRGFGDFQPKSHIGWPDVQKILIDENWEFLLLATDGIWDVTTREAVCNYVRERIARNMNPLHICQELLNDCLAKEPKSVCPGTDNMAVILVCFMHNKPYTTLVEHCRKNFFINKLKPTKL